MIRFGDILGRPERQFIVVSFSFLVNCRVRGEHLEIDEFGAHKGCPGGVLQGGKRGRPDLACHGYANFASSCASIVSRGNIVGAGSVTYLNP